MMNECSGFLIKKNIETVNSNLTTKFRAVMIFIFSNPIKNHSGNCEYTVNCKKDEKKSR